MAKEIKIAPSADEILFSNKTHELRTVFNDMELIYIVTEFINEKDDSIKNLKDSFSMSIAMASKTWQVNFFMNEVVKGNLIVKSLKK